MQLRAEGSDPMEVRAGEVVMLPHNNNHLFGGEFNSMPTLARDIVQAPHNGGLARIEYGGGGEATQLVCGFLGCDTPFNPLLTALPTVLKPNVGITPSGAWIESSFRFAASEIAAGRLGSTTVLAKLSELLFVEAISQFVARLPVECRGWLAGLRNPQISRPPALLHARPMEEWVSTGDGAAATCRH
jgi:hypothetical protein